MKVETMEACEDSRLRAELTAVRTIAGVTGGSALLRQGDELIAVHDDAFRVTRIALPALTSTPWILAGDGRVLPKAEKPDFEAAVRLSDGVILVLGSGSTPLRCRIARLDVARRTGSVGERPDLYAALTRALGTGARPNIEGAVADARRLELFHRGSGGAPSAILELPATALLEPEPIADVAAIRWCVLGALDGVPLAFTDAAALPDGRVAFAAAAEDTVNAVADGPVAGSVLGVLDGARSQARWTRLLDVDGTPYRQKAEGLVVDADARGGWILTDADDASSSAALGRVTLSGFAERFDAR